MMATVFGLDTHAVRADSQRAISRLGGTICDWLPYLDRSKPRPSSVVVRRALVMNALVQIYFGAPPEVIHEWLDRNGLLSDLSNRERELLSESGHGIVEQDRIDLYWYLEALWTFAWIGSFIDDLPIELPLGDELATFFPDLQADEGPERLETSFILRQPDEIYRKLDLYYLAHWYARDGQLRKYATGVFSLDAIMERRKALEWVLDSDIDDWDHTPAST